MLLYFVLELSFRDSSSDEEEIVNKKNSGSGNKKTSRSKQIDSEEENGGFLSDGYDADFYGDFEDRNRLLAMNEVEREAILYERAQTRQARQERRSLEQRIREREEFASGKRAPSKEIDLKRKRLNELKAKRERKLLSHEDDEEEGEFESSAEEEEDDEEEEKRRASKKKKSRKSTRKDSDDDYYSDEEAETAAEKKAKKASSSKKTSSNSKQIEIESDREEDGSEALDLEMANKLRLSRDILAQWVYRDGFEDICQKCLLRISLGADREGRPTYRVVELKKIVAHHRSYSVKPGTPTNLAALVKFAKNERIFSFEFVSNSPFTQSELDYWKRECSKTGVRIPYDNLSARRKIDKLKAFHAEPLSDSVISRMLESRKELTNEQNAPRNLLAEQTILQQQLKEALERTNGDEEVSRIEAELAAIQVKRQMSESKDRLSGMEDLNRRNRLTNLETGRQAEISRMQSELIPLSADHSSNSDKQKKPPTLDPFQRRKCKPTLIHMNGSEEQEQADGVIEIKKEEEDKKHVVLESAPETKESQTANLFDAHNFDLDIDI